MTALWFVLLALAWALFLAALLLPYRPIMRFRSWRFRERREGYARWTNDPARRFPRRF